MRGIRIFFANFLAFACLIGLGYSGHSVQAAFPLEITSRPVQDLSSNFPVDDSAQGQISTRPVTQKLNKSILELCDLGKLFNCQKLQRPGLPPAPPGYAWKRVDGLFTFSAYAHPTEADYMGDRVKIPGISGLTAKEDFLFAVDGIGMQGGGYIQRTEPGRGYLNFYIKYISGHWELSSEDVIIEDRWYFSKDRSPVSADLISQIRLEDGRFSIMTDPQLIPYYSVAGPARFELGTQIYVPSLSNYGGFFEVQDRGGAFSEDSRRFDIFVGTEMTTALEWIRLDRARSNLPVYVLQVNGK